MDRAERIAGVLATDWETKAPYRPLAGDLAPADLAEAYRAQALLQERLTARRGAIVGRKIALSSKAMQEMLRVSAPVAGVFFERDVRASPASVALEEFNHLGIEFELAVELGRDVAPGDAPHDGESVRALIAAVRPAFELIDDGGVDYDAIDALALVAGNAWCGGVVFGDPISDWRERDLDALAGTIEQTGREPERVITGAAAPLASLAWVLNHASADGLTVRRGEYVITGSAARTRFPAPGDRVRYALDGLAAVEVTIA